MKLLRRSLIPSSARLRGLALAAALAACTTSTEPTPPPVSSDAPVEALNVDARDVGKEIGGEVGADIAADIGGDIGGDGGPSDRPDAEPADANSCPHGYIPGYDRPGCGSEAKLGCVASVPDASAETYCTCEGVTVTDRTQGRLMPFRHIGFCGSPDGGSIF